MSEFKLWLKQFLSACLHKDMTKVSTQKTEALKEKWMNIKDECAIHRKSAIKSILKQVPYLLTKPQETVITDKNMGAIIEDVILNAEAKGLLYRRNFVDHVVRHAVNNYSAKSVTVPPALTLPIEVSKSTPVTFRIRKNNFSRLVNVFLTSLDGLNVSGENKLSDDDRMAQMFLSSMMFGGILHKNVFINFAEMSFSDVRVDKGYMWIDVPADRKMAVEGTTRRFWVDSVTAQLIRLLKKDMNINSNSAQFLSNWGDINSWSEKRILDVIKSFLRKFGCKGKYNPTSLPKLMKWIYMGHSRYIPSYSLDFAAGRNISYSLSRSCHNRFMNGFISSSTNTSATTVDFFNDTTVITIPNNNFNRVAISPDEKEASKTISKYLLNEEHESLEEYLKDNKEIISPALKYLVDWCLKLSKGEITGRKANKGKSVYDCFMRLSERLVTYSLGQDFATVDSAWLEDVYEAVLDQEHVDSTQTKRGQDLKSFHEFLHEQGLVEKFDFYELDGFVPSRHSVRANVLMPHEYVKLLDKLWLGRNPDDRLGRMRYLIAILGYRLGMRRREILQLRYCDIKGRIYVQINVRKNKRFSIKSRNAKRRLPLHDLLTDDELYEIKAWVKQRKNESATRHELLFCQKEEVMIPLSNYHIYTIIHKTLFAVTNNKDLRFHALRHSFATWLQVMLESHRLSSIHDPRIKAFENLDISSCPGLYGFDLLLDLTRPTKKILYQLSILIGHSNVRMSLLYYCHLNDWILHHYMNTRIPSFTASKVGALMGYKPATVAKKLMSISPDENNKYDLTSCLPLARNTLQRDDWVIAA